MRINIKRKPINKKKLLRGAFAAGVAGLVFGTIAALSFAFLFRGLEDYMEKRSSAVIIQTEVNTGGGADDKIDVDQDNNVVKETGYRELYTIASRAEKAVVRINVTKTESYSVTKGDSKVKTGIVFSKTAKSLYILTTPDSARGKTFVDITFYEGTTYSGRVIETDYISGLSVVKVETPWINQTLIDTIPIIELANSNKTAVGDMVVAIGNINGYIVSSIAGNVSSVNNTFSVTDGELQMIGTDIPARASDNGFLFNSDGLLCGIISHGDDSADSRINFINAIGCSDLTSTIYKLSEGIHFPYMGIKTTTINNVTASIYDIPLGIFITAVEMDSPAFDAGLMVGDIIVAAGDEGMLTGRKLHSFLMGINLDKAAERTINFRVLRMNNGLFGSKNIEVDLGNRY